MADEKLEPTPEAKAALDAVRGTAPAKAKPAAEPEGKGVAEAPTSDLATPGKKTTIEREGLPPITIKTN